MLGLDPGVHPTENGGLKARLFCREARLDRAVNSSRLVQREATCPVEASGPQ